jgi:hypothetical protein
VLAKYAKPAGTAYNAALKLCTCSVCTTQPALSGTMEAESKETAVVHVTRRCGWHTSVHRGKTVLVPVKVSLSVSKLRGIERRTVITDCRP